MPDVQEVLKDLLISSLEGAGKSGGNAGERRGDEAKSSGGHSAARGLVAGVGAAALTHAALKGLGKVAREAGMDGVQDLAKSPGKAVQGLGASVAGQAGSKLTDKVSEKLDDAGGASGILSDTVKGMVSGGDGGGGSKGGGLGIGKGRRMPVQQSVDVAAPLATVYNQWTQFEDWPQFMHRVVRASQDDDCTVTFAVKIWTRTREFTANIETQRPDERINWKVGQGITHAGVVSFHELAPNLTRVLLAIDVQPGGMIEKMARGMRHVKRAARGDLHRFKAFIEMAEQESGAWRGVIEDGEVTEEHDPAYDDEREYSDVEDVLEQGESSAEDDGEGEQDEDARGSSDDKRDKAQRPRTRERRPSTNGGSADEETQSKPARQRSRSRAAPSSSRPSGPSGPRSGGGGRPGSSRSSDNDSGPGGSSRRSPARSSSSPRTRSRSANN